MTLEFFIWEIAKLLMQAVGALVVARLAVKWALDRFKQEKLWERRLAAHADIITALGEMRRMYGIWIDELEMHRDPPEETNEEHWERYKSAQHRLGEVSALGALLLPPATNERLARLERDRQKISRRDQYEAYNHEYSLLDDAISDLVQDGRSLLP